MKNILVLYSERHIARLIQVNLERQGCCVRLEQSVSEGWQYIAEERPDSVLIDMLMTPDIVQLIKKMKSDPATRHIRIIRFSPRFGEADVFKGWSKLPGLSWGAGLYELLDDMFDNNLYNYEDDETKH